MARRGQRRLVKADAAFAGVDGGGTRCRVRIRDGNGRLLGTADGGAANVYLDFEQAIATIEGTVARALADTGLARDNVRLGLGLAGVSAPTVADRVRAALSGYRHVVTAQDGVVACLGAHGGDDGGLVIAGTGSVAVLRLHGEIVSIGGRGFLLGDDGSGAWLGRAALRRALRAADGLEPSSALLDMLLGRFSDDPVALIAWARTAPSHAFAALAPKVFGAAAAGDEVGGSLVADAAAAIAELIQTLFQRGAPRVSLVGGMADAITPFLSQPLRDRLAPPVADPLEGALLLAGLAAPAAPTA